MTRDEVAEATVEAAEAAEQLAAHLGRLAAGETLAGMSAKNQFRRLEAIGGLESADGWLELGTIRNLLAHDYPTNPSAQAERANRVWFEVPALIEDAGGVVSFIRSEILSS